MVLRDDRRDYTRNKKAPGIEGFQAGIEFIFERPSSEPGWWREAEVVRPVSHPNY